jgi:hypothetical protein
MAVYGTRRSFDNMPRTRKVCPICGRKRLLKLSNHLANVHKLASHQRQPYLIRAKKIPADMETVLYIINRLIETHLCSFS